MAEITWYGDGTATVAVGSRKVYGNGTGWLTEVAGLTPIKVGDKFGIHVGRPIVVETIDGDEELTLADDWPGPAQTDAPYKVELTSPTIAAVEAMRRLLASLSNGNLDSLSEITVGTDDIPIGIGPGVFGTINKAALVQGVEYDAFVPNLAGRAVYNGAAAGFSVLVIDIGDGRSALYFKNSATSGDWSAPSYITGPVGPAGVNQRGNYSAGTAYAIRDIVQYGGSTWIAKVATTGNAPPTLPTTENTQWLLFARSGTPGVVDRGTYSGAAAYEANDIVLDAGSTWLALQPTTGHAPPVLPVVENAYWRLLSAKGSDGNALGIENPQGRLSVVNGVAIPSSDVVAATTIYYVPCIGTRVPVWNGTEMVLRDIGGGLSVPLSATYLTAFNQTDWFVFVDGSTVRLGHGPNWADGAVAGSQFARGSGAGSTEIEMRSGILVNKNSITLRFGTAAGDVVTVPANQATYVGSSGNDGSAGTITDSKRLRLLFNAYNQVQRPVALPGSGATWTYGAAAFRVLNNDNTQYVGIFNGLPSHIDLSASVDVVNSSATISVYTLALGLDSTTVVPPAASNGLYSSWSGVVATLLATYKDTPSIGMHRFYPLENAASGVAATWRYFSGYGVRGSVMI